MCQSIKLPTHSNFLKLTTDCFRSMPNLVSISIPSSVTEIHGNVFHGCTSLSEVIFMGDNVTTISDYAFADTAIKSFKFPLSITVISSNIFKRCKKLTSIEFPSSATTFSANIIDGCESLKSITLPASTKEVKAMAFGGAAALENILFKEASSFYKSQDGVLMNSDNDEIVVYPSGRKRAVFASHIKSIRAHSFYRCIALTELSFGSSSVKKIPDSSFYGCTNLTNLSLPSSISTLEANAFNGCSSIVHITFLKNSTLKSIGVRAFSGCKAIEDVIFEDGAKLETIEDSVFKDCEKLCYFNFPPLLEKIGSSAFEGCSSFKRVVFQNKLREIGNKAFEGCSSIISLTIPPNFTKFGSDAFKDCTSLERLEYCGSNIFTGVVFNGSKVRFAYVKNSYNSTELCDLKCQKVFDKDCMLPTLTFTSGYTAILSAQAICVAFAISDGKGDDGRELGADKGKNLLFSL